MKFQQIFNVTKFIQTFHWIVTCSMLVCFIYVLYHLPVIENFYFWHQKSRYNWDITYQMKKEVCFNVNQLIWTILHRLVHGTSYLFNVSLTHAYSVLFSSERNETKLLRFPFWLNIFGKIFIQMKNRKLLKRGITFWATLNSTVSYYRLVKDI